MHEPSQKIEGVRPMPVHQVLRDGTTECSHIGNLSDHFVRRRRIPSSRGEFCSAFSVASARPHVCRRIASKSTTCRTRVRRSRPLVVDPGRRCGRRRAVISSLAVEIYDVPDDNSSISSSRRPPKDDARRSRPLVDPHPNDRSSISCSISCLVDLFGRREHDSLSISWSISSLVDPIVTDPFEGLSIVVVRDVLTVFAI